jgi:hypothetical protein
MLKFLKAKVHVNIEKRHHRGLSSRRNVPVTRIALLSANWAPGQWFTKGTNVSVFSPFMTATVWGLFNTLLNSKASEKLLFRSYWIQFSILLF